MERNKNKHPGFIDGLKASNISTNKTSLTVSSEQIDNIISLISKQNNSIESITTNAERLQKIIKETLEQGISAEELIQKYIKFGDTYKSALLHLRVINDLDLLKEIAVNYLQIAKYTKDTRIKNLAVEIAEELEN